MEPLQGRHSPASCRGLQRGTLVVSSCLYTDGRVRKSTEGLSLIEFAGKSCERQSGRHSLWRRMQSGAHNSNSVPGGATEPRTSHHLREAFNMQRAFAFSSRSSISSGRNAHSTSTPRKLLKTLNRGRQRARLPDASSFTQFFCITPQSGRRSRPTPSTQPACFITENRPWAR